MAVCTVSTTCTSTSLRVLDYYSNEPDKTVIQKTLDACGQQIGAKIDEGVRVIAGHSEASAIKGRAHQKRKLPV